MENQRGFDLFIPQNEEERKMAADFVRQRLLDRCIDAFGDLHESVKRPQRLPHCPPKTAIIEYVVMRPSSFGSQKRLPKRERIWLLRNGCLEELKDLGVEAKLNKKSGMYFEQALMSIRVDIEQAQAYYSFIFGPLFGRGYVIDLIRRDDNTVAFGSERIWWIS